MLILLLSSLIKTANLILINDIEFNDNPPRGILVLDLYLLYSNPLYWKSKFYYGCDETNFSPLSYYVQCDTLIYSRGCTFVQNDDEYLYKRIGKRRFTETNFKVSMKRLVSSTYRAFLLCTDIIETKLPEQRNENDYRNNPLFMSTVSLQYSKYIQITIDGGDDTQYLHGQEVSYLSYVNVAKYFNVDFLHITNWELKINVQFMGSVFLLIFQHYMKCDKDYFGSTCWFKCEPNPRSTCICDKQKSYNTLTCTIECKENYLGRYVSYLIGDRRVMIKVCDVINPCLYTPCSTGVCLPLDNSTRFCETMEYYITEINKDIRITGAYYAGDSYHVFVDFDKFSKPFSKVTNKIYIYLNQTEQVFNHSLKLLYTGVQFTVRKDAIIDVQFQYNIGFYLQPWNKIIHKNVQFRIFSKPYKVEIYNFERNKLIDKYLFIGDNITCNTSAAPLSRVKFLWTSNVLKFINATLSKQYIKPTYGLVDANITCLVTFLMYDNKTENNSKTIYVIFKIYQTFTWSILRNLVTIYDHPECIAISNTKYKIIVIQIDGPSEIEIKNSTISFKNATGGTYSFYCLFILMTKVNQYFSKSITYDLRVMPTYVCFHFYPVMYGSIVQCGHNGYLKDEYLILVKLYIIAQPILLVSQRYGYVKIPFYMSSPSYKVICQILPKLNQHLQLNSTHREEIIYSTKYQYLITYSMKVCAKEFPYVQNPIEQTQDTKSAKITIYLLAFNMVYRKNYVEIILPFIILIITVSLILSELIYIIVFAYGSISYFRLTKQARETRHKLTRGRIICRIESEIYKIQQDYNLEIINLYKVSFSTFQSS